MEDSYISVPYKYSPLSPWAYFWLQVLYAIPIVGTVFLIIHAINPSNINRRNFARSYFCIYILVAIVIGLIWLCGLGSLITA